MTVDIRGTNSFNLGARLMLHAAVAELAPHFPLSAPPQLSDYALRGGLGLRQTLVWNQTPRLSIVAGDAVPGVLKTAFGMVSHAQVTGVVDASGFAYSDSFTRRRIMREAVFARAWARRGVPVVLLPQAFGPFTDRAKRDWTRRLLLSARLVFARDRRSLEFLGSLEVDTEIRLSPDFTIPVPPAELAPISAEPFGAIVPNFKLVSSGRISRDAYIGALIGYANGLSREGLVPVVVIHDHNDREIAEAVSSAGAKPIAIYASDDPTVLKAALGQAELVVSSRFHAIVSALSGGVPTLALGWSHKYGELLNDFHVPDWAVDVEAPPADGLALLTATPRDLAAATLADAKRELTAKVRAMWDETRAVLSGTDPRS